VVIEMRTLSYVSFAEEHAHECENLVVMCMDFRFHEKVSQVIEHSGYRQFDLVAMPGGSKSITDEATRAAALAAIEIGVSVHHIRRVIIVDHVDCRAYGGSEAFESPEAEESRHADALLQAGRIIHERSPELEVLPVYADWGRVKTVD
jgi:carbonic anhydrase